MEVQRTDLEGSVAGDWESMPRRRPERWPNSRRTRTRSYGPFQFSIRFGRYNACRLAGKSWWTFVALVALPRGCRRVRRRAGPAARPGTGGTRAHVPPTTTTDHADHDDQPTTPRDHDDDCASGTAAVANAERLARELPVFPADNAWNTDVSAAPVHAELGELHRQHPRQRRRLPPRRLRRWRRVRHSRTSPSARASPTCPLTFIDWPGGERSRSVPDPVEGADRGRQRPPRARRRSRRLRACTSCSTRRR